MVKTEKDERKVEIVRDNKIQFSYNNVQIYTNEQARNVYVSMLYELKEKEKYIKKFKELKEEGDERLDQQLSQMMTMIQKQNPEIDMVTLKHWKKVQTIQNQSQLLAQMKKVKEDINDLKEGLKIWNCCKDLPETEHEKKLKEKFENE